MRAAFPQAVSFSECPVDMNTSSSEYRKRIKFALIVSLVIHLLVIFAAGVHLSRTQIGTAAVSRKPIVLNLQKPKPKQVRKLVDSHTESEEAIEETDLISDMNSKAQDMSDVDSGKPTPLVEEFDDFERLASLPRPKPAAQPKPPPQPRQPDQKEQVESRKAPKEHELKTTAMLNKPLEEKPKPVEKKMAKMEAIEEIKPEEEPAPPEEPHNNITQAPKGGGVVAKGFAGFEALKHELAPYMKNIRNRVEVRWRTLLEMRYSGVTTTTAVIDCAINPDGELVSVTIIEMGDSVSFAPLCKEAIEQAKPFGPFPFDVPDIYRTKNLEIRWSFNFM